MKYLRRYFLTGLVVLAPTVITAYLAWWGFTRIDGLLQPLQRRYPIIDIPMSHAIHKTLFEVTEIPQIPSIQHFRRSGYTTTSERGARSAEVHFRAITDKAGRILVLMSHNTDIADGWEREGEDYEFFFRFSVDAYELGINIVVHSMTH